jgi:hypothetical protein
LAIDFNIDIIQKLKITKFNKKIPVLNYSSDKNEYIEIDKDDYLITFDGYLKYKKKNPTKYYNENLFKLDVDSFSSLNFENNSQVKSFENFKYSKAHKITSIWDLDNNPDQYHPSSSTHTPYLKQKSDFIKFKDDDLGDCKDEIYNENENTNIDENDDDEYFNYASFDIEEDITKTINEYFNPNISEINNPKKNKYGHFVNFKEEQQKFKKSNLLKAKKQEDLYNDYYEDLKLKMKSLKNGENLIKKISSENDIVKEQKKSESSKVIPDLSGKKKNKNKSKLSLPLIVLPGHFKNN